MYIDTNDIHFPSFLSVESEVEETNKVDDTYSTQPLEVNVMSGLNQ